MEVMHWELGLSKSRGTSELHRLVIQTLVALTTIALTQLPQLLLMQGRGAPYDPLA